MVDQSLFIDSQRTEESKQKDAPMSLVLSRNSAKLELADSGIPFMFIGSKESS
jgi:hypothetical protein